LTLAVLVIGASDLEFVWDFGFGDWDLEKRFGACNLKTGDANKCH
jgi:hypothetical protein